MEGIDKFNRIECLLNQFNDYCKYDTLSCVLSSKNNC